MFLTSASIYHWARGVSRDDSITPAILILVFVVLPIVSVRGYYQLRSGKPLPPKEKRFSGTVVGQLVVLLPAMASARSQGLELWPLRFPTLWQWLVGAFTLTALLLWICHLWRAKLRAMADQARLHLPENPEQLRYWVLVSLMAGAAEEYVYRGVVYAAVVSLTGKAFSATLICAVAFGAAHLSFGLRSSVWTALSGVLLQTLVLWTGALYLSIALHVTYDLMVGIVAMRILMRGHLPQFAPAEPASLKEI